MERGLIFNIQRYCTDDGAGIRTTIFFKGCPLRCRWCHNPESWLGHAQLLYDERKCIGCGLCAAACSSGCHTMEKGHIFTRNGCVLCGDCAKVCPGAALELCGKQMSAEDITALVKKDKVYYKNGGGATLSGGEPLAQGTFAVALAKALWENEISVNVETCGYGSGAVVKQMAPYCDRFLFDIKATAADYPAYTGVAFDSIYENLMLLSSLGAAITLRCPIVPGCNDSEEFAVFVARIAQESGADTVQLLPYHSGGIGKCSLLGAETQPVFDVPSAEILTRLAGIISGQTSAQVTVSAV